MYVHVCCNEFRTLKWIPHITNPHMLSEDKFLKPFVSGPVNWSDAVMPQVAFLYMGVSRHGHKLLTIEPLIDRFYKR